MKRHAVGAAAIFVAALACERERVDVAETTADDAGASSHDAPGPIFAHPPEAGADAGEDAGVVPTCGGPPPVSLCGPCPNGYVIDAGCKCCP